MVGSAGAGYIETREDGTTVIHVKVALLPDPTRTDTYTRAEVAGIKAFRQRFQKIFAERYRDKYKASPHIYGRYNWDKVEIQLDRASGIQVSGVENDLLPIAGGVAPDVLYVNFRKSDNYIQSGFLYPLDKPEDNYFSSITKAELDFRVNKKIWPVIRRKGPSGKKHVWALPYGGALGRVLVYRKDLFDANNLAYPDKNWTWESLYTACRKITDPAKGIYGLKLAKGKHESWDWVTFLWSAGGDVMVYNEKTDEWRCVFDTIGAAKALDFHTKLVTEKWTDQNGKIRRGYVYREGQARTKWDRGEIGMQFEYIDEKLFSTINPDVTGMAPVPLGPPDANGKRIRGAELNSRMLGLFSEIPQRAVRDAAWEYLRWYDCKEAVRIKTKVMVEGGLGQFVNPRYLRMFGYSEIERLAPKGWSEIFKIVIATGKPEPYGKGSNFAYDMMTIPMHEAQQLALGGDLPIDETERLTVLQGLLKDAVAKANEEMIGIISPEERRKRDITAAIVLAAIVIAFGLVFRKIFKAFTPPKVEGESKAKYRWNFRKYKWAYILLIPGVLTILLWRYIPLLRGSVMAFQDYKILGESSWVWLKNFGDLLYDSFWWKAVYNALRYSFLVVALTFLPPIILAILLQEVPRGRLLFRTIFYLPAVITGLVTIILWKQFYEKSEHGVLNMIVMHVPAIGFIVIGGLLFALLWTFSRRMKYHNMTGLSWLFLGIGVLLFVTCSDVAYPILFPGCDTISEIAGSFLWHTVETDNPVGVFQWIVARIPVVAFVAMGTAFLVGGIIIRRRLNKQNCYGRYAALGVGLVGLAAALLFVKYAMYPASESLWYMVKYVVCGAWWGISHLFDCFTEPLDWLEDSGTAMLACVVPMVWAGMGPGCLIYLAALKGIPDDFYEAADIDGATFIDKILFVVFPILKPLILINFIGVFIGSWYGATGRILAMTAGGADTEVAGLYIFYKAFMFLKFGPATAAAWVLAFLLIGFTVHQLRILSRLEFRTTGKKE